MTIIELRDYARIKAKMEAKDAKTEDFSDRERSTYEEVLLKARERLIDGR